MGAYNSTVSVILDICMMIQQHIVMKISILKLSRNNKHFKCFTIKVGICA